MRYFMEKCAVVSTCAVVGRARLGAPTHSPRSIKIMGALVKHSEQMVQPSTLCPDGRRRIELRSGRNCYGSEMQLITDTNMATNFG
jgi:hypothetical protein